MAEINTDQYFPDVKLVILDSKGRPARVDGIPVWASSDETVLHIVPAGDGMSAVVHTVAPGGPARISISADADLGAGVQEITGVSEDVNVSQGPSSIAATITLDLGTPAEKP